MKTGPGRDERPIFSRFSLREDVQREIDAHVAMRAEELEGSGVSHEEAEAEARRLLGDRSSIVDRCVRIVRSHHRAVRRARTMDALVQDIRFGLRTLLRNPGFTAVAVLTLALGIGANSAIFSVVYGVLLAPLPFDEPAELVVIQETGQRGGRMQVAWPNFTDWRSENTVLDGIFAYRPNTTTVLGGDDPHTAQVTVTTLGIWSTMGAAPLMGRLTTEADHREGAPVVAVVSESFWRNALSARPLAELSIEMSGRVAQVVGVAPVGFDFPSGTDVWYALEITDPSTSRTAHNWQVVGRMSDGIPLPVAQEQLNSLTVRIVGAEPQDDLDFLAAGASVRPLLDQIVGGSRATLLLLLGAAGLVLLVACTNLASTLLARGANRSREFALRASLGAQRGRIVRQLLTESVLVAGGGAIAGLGLAAMLLGAVRRLGPVSIPRIDAVSLNPTVLAYTAVIAVATAVLFGLFPAMRLTREASGSALRSGSRGNALGQGRAWTILVATEVALALVLVVGAGLLVRSFTTLLAEDTGFDGTDVMTSSVTLSNITYPDGAAHAAFWDQALAQLASTPGISSVGLTSSVPMAGFLPNGRIELDGDLENHAEATYVVVSEGTFDALDVPLVSGRSFSPTDTPDQPHVAIVSESFANQYWPGENPIGRTLTGGGMDRFWQERRFAEVVGVVGDVRYRRLDQEAGPTIYFPYTQRPSRISFGAIVLAESSTANAATVATALRSTIQGLDSNIPVDVRSQESLIGASVAGRQFTMLLLGGFSLLALVLAVVGIYGVVSYTVARRKREMGVRIALGAEPQDVVSLVVRRAMRMVAVGLAVGAIASLAAGRILQGMLYGVTPLDPIALVIGVLSLGGAALLASWIPARGSTRVDPMIAMRAE